MSPIQMSSMHRNFPLRNSLQTDTDDSPSLTYDIPLTLVTSDLLLDGRKCIYFATLLDWEMYRTETVWFDMPRLYRPPHKPVQGIQGNTMTFARNIQYQNPNMQRYTEPEF
ncbi:hypothetical protein AB6A40_002529 [Gnathostoma spinigerum]|uniref:Uncharacterized protein n=1 Tax=Gnathostoma spinigerum TaxID=75299 RepID=A0ABD6E807_9BILA